MNYTPLHVHSDYSLLDGLMSTKELVNRVKKNNMSHVALTDHGTMRGLIDFYYECSTANITPVLGEEFYFTEDRRSKEEQLNGKAYYHTTILAENVQGWKNMISLTTQAANSGFYYKPRIDYELIERYHEGIFMGSGCFGSIFSFCALHDNKSKFNDLFGFFTPLLKDRFYIELTAAESIEQKVVNYNLLRQAKDRGIKHVFMSDAHWATKEDYKVHDFLYTMNTGGKYGEPGRKKFPTEETWLKSYDEMWEYWLRELKEFDYKGRKVGISEEDFAEGLENTNWIASQCSVDIEEIHQDYLMPSIEVKDPKQYLIERSYKHRREYLNKLDGNRKQQYFNQLLKETDLIVGQGFSGYFIMTADLCDYMRENKILKGLGRGSAGGSLLSFMLGITEIDPMLHGLTFERFMNENKKSMPDIDIDINDEKRQDVLDYFIDKYGIDNVAQIGTNITMKPKLASKMVAKTLGIPFDQANEASDAIETEDYENENVKFLMSKYSGWLPLTKRMVGKTRAIGKHAAGIIVGNQPLDTIVPLQRGKSDTFITEWTDGLYRKELTEVLKLLKFDLLGLSNLAIIQDTLDQIRANNNSNLLRLDLSDQDLLGYIPLDVEHVYENIFPDDGSHKTIGVFQFDTPSMGKLLTMINPRNISQLCALNSINRPATKKAEVDVLYSESYKSGVIKYDHPSLEPILRETYGQIIYQEQVMEIANKIGGMSMAETDLFRKVLVKFTEANKEEQDEIRSKTLSKFIEGAISNGLSGVEANKLADKLAEFAGYGFNKSHSRAYAILAYYTMYLKTYFPIEFLVAYLNKRPDELHSVIQEVGFDMFLPVDINKSKDVFTIDKERIRLGFGCVKGLGNVAIQEIVSKQPFDSRDHFIELVERRKVNKTRLKALKNAGALMPFGSEAQNQTTFSDEMNVLGVPIATNNSWLIEFLKPIVKFVNKKTKKSYECTNIKDADNLKDGDWLYVLGVLVDVKNKNFTSKKNTTWSAFGFTGTLLDETGFLDIMSFNFRDKRLRSSKVVGLLGKKKTFGNKTQLDVNRVEFVFDYRSLSPGMRKRIDEAKENVL